MTWGDKEKAAGEGGGSASYGSSHTDSAAMPASSGPIEDINIEDIPF